MNEYIERNKLKEHILDDIAVCGEPDAYHRPIAYGTMLGLKGALSYVNTLPAADVEEVRHGEWRDEKWMNTHQHICSLCFATVRVHPHSVEYKYCPYCGAKMDGGKE